MNYYFKSRIHIWIIVVVLLVTISTITKTVKAQEADSINLTVSPIFFDLTTNPQATIHDKIRLRNNSGTPIKLSLGVYKLLSKEANEASLENPQPEDSYINWLKLEKNSLTAPSREWVEIKFDIEIPKEAAFGYYWAIRVTSDIDPDQPAVAKLRGEIVIPLLLNVKKDGAQAQAQLVEFKPTKYIYEDLPSEFTVKVVNNGNIHIKPRGNIFISGQGNKDLAALEVNEGMSSILPQGTRTFTSYWDDGFLIREPQEDGKTKLKINWDKVTSLRFGPYTANLLMVYDDGKRDVAIEGTAQFWIIPYKLIGITLISIISILFIIRLLIKQYINKELRARSSA